MRTGEVEILPIDDHEIHIDEHISYILSNGIKDCKNYEEVKLRILNHIENHKIMQNKNN